MKRYEVTGIPLGPSPVQGHAVGHVVRLNLSDEAERALVDAGAIRPLSQPPQSKPKGKADDDE